jgi:D-alanyl-D-alanine carboxypeptidase
MIGTTAGLRSKTWVKFPDLFYGAMLPSGNDAAFLLS